ncbi:alginate lyase family protein [Fibrobacter sp. HC4]|uniref:heparinase II/III family protein n=1 Tax=Fibrobacter sp. HC4 TaxID=3239812 RepID=UPI00201961E5|nr:alginate lyase family protein [Fibrobacter succinogenes]MCL4102637.1 hypothetical protein [Fibrobacter succinogenes]
MSLVWYIQRIKTFSPEEVFYRVGQRFRTHVLDKRLFKRNVAECNLEGKVPPRLVADENAHLMYPIFESAVDIYKPIDWHRDLSSGRSFPETFAHKINIRSDEFGSAKHVWEVNRMLFLTRIAKLFKESGNRDLLDLFVYHVSSWMDSNPYLRGVNWYSNIEVNIRLINWAYCWKLLDAENLCKSDENFGRFVREVWLPLVNQHIEFSRKHPSLYSSANNHLVAEYAGLFIASCCWDFLKREKYRAYAKAGLEREILLQNVSDGVNREEAAEYIQFIDDFFLLASVMGDEAGCPLSSSYKDRLHQMARYLNAMLDVNYNYPMYGDGDDGFLLRPDAGGHFNNFRSLLTSFATYFADASLKRSDLSWDDKNQLIFDNQGKAAFDALNADGDNPDKNVFLTESGHYIFRKMAGGRETFLHFDAAPLGFLSIAAHGHADALSIILHVDGFPVVVDSGTFTYHTHKVWRKYFMGTVAHNTVRVDFMDQATQAGPTMWLNHFKCRALQVENDSVVATHSGYDKLGVCHSRKVEFLRDQEEFIITDSLKSDGSHDAEIPFHLSPCAQVVETSKGVFVISVAGARQVQITTDPSLEYRIVSGEESPVMGWYSEHFGEKVPCKVLYAQKKCSGNSSFETKIKVLS